MLKRSIALLLIIIGGNTFAQRTGKLRVYIKPAEEVVLKIDNQYLKSGEIVELDTGTYTLSAWATKRNLYSNSIEITPNGFKTVPIKLRYSPDYLRYKRRCKVYDFKIIALKHGAVIAYGVISAKFLVDIFRLNKDADRHLDLAKAHQQEYTTSIYQEDINNNKVFFQRNKDAYDSDLQQINKRLLFIQAGAVAAVIVRHFTRKKIDSVKQPGYYERTLLSRLQVQPELTPFSQGVNMKFNF